MEKLGGLLGYKQFGKNRPSAKTAAFGVCGDFCRTEEFIDRREKDITMLFSTGAREGLIGNPVKAGGGPAAVTGVVGPRPLSRRSALEARRRMGRPGWVIQEPEDLPAPR
jgi:hypothetical protein